ncbi:hypothetical protein AWB64_05273 [Caballeronia sordidicola]|uniref:Uncharacterized protein n=1 Tax=Caballeronia sordidicola TaxID=196367 RepID=A0A158I175_CABSO|nr:hypothetical protein [Caballeronia sordidicola]SAL50053.1 hypothetical protein AWB64_05273 [Caballeronia sordidicola]
MADPDSFDPVEHADERRKALGDGDVTEYADGTIEQKEHGSMDASLVPKGKDHPEQGPCVPEHDHLDPDVESHPGSEHPKGKTGSEA